MAYNTNADRISNKIAENSDVSLGKRGFDLNIRGEQAVSPASGTYMAIQFVGDTIFAELEIDGVNVFAGAATPNASDLTFPKGSIIYGNVTKYHVAADSINQILILYKAK
jgi:hypothetical protein